jgi:hypothetical protein
MPPQLFHYLLRERAHVRQQHAIASLFDRCLERVEDVLLHLLAQSGNVAQPLGHRRLAELLDRADPQLGVDLARGLRAETGDPGELDEAGRELLLQLCRCRDLARLEQRSDLFLDCLADALESGQTALLGELLDRHRRLPHRARRLAVRDDAVHDRTVELIEVGELVKGVRDFSVVHCRSLTSE